MHALDGSQKPVAIRCDTRLRGMINEIAVEDLLQCISLTCRKAEVDCVIEVLDGPSIGPSMLFHFNVKSGMCGAELHPQTRHRGGPRAVWGGGTAGGPCPRGGGGVSRRGGVSPRGGR